MFNGVQKKESYHTLLKLFNPVNLYSLNGIQEVAEQDLEFNDHHHIVSFFVDLLKSFNLIQLTNSIESFRYLLEKWNEEHQETIIQESDLLEKDLIISANERVIVNPSLRFFIKENDDYNQPELEFLKIFSHSHFDCPLFTEEVWLPILEQHNEKFNHQLLEKEEILGGAADLYSVLFHNYRNIKSSFLTALQHYFSTLEYNEWEKNIEKYFYLLVEINNCEIFTSDILFVLDSTKLNILIEFVLQKLLSESEIHKIEDLEFLSRIQQVKFDGKDFLPMKDNTTQEKVEVKKSNYTYNFGKILERERFFEEFEFRSYYMRLFPEVKFIFQNLITFITPEQWEKVLIEKKSIIYDFYFYENVLFDVTQTINYDSIDLAPIIIEKLLSLDVNLNRITTVNLKRLKVDTLKFYLEIVKGEKEEYMKFLIDLYIYLTNCVQKYGKINVPIINEFRSYLIDYIQKQLNGEVFSENALKLITDERKDNEFIIFDLPVQLSKENLIVKKELAQLIKNEYLDFLNSERLFSSFFQISGLANILYSFQELDDNDLVNDVTSIIFSFDATIYEGQEDKKWTKYFSLSKRLRVHLGVLSIFLRTSEIPNKIREKLIIYVLNMYRDLKLTQLDGNCPVSWENMIFDIFSLEGESGIDQEKILWFHILCILNERETSEKQKFLNEIQMNLTFSEAVLWNKIIGDIKINLSDYSPITNGVSLGLAKKEAFFLVRSGYGNEALKYIEYVKSLIAEKHLDYLDKNFYFNVEFEALIQIGRYDEAYELADVILDNRGLSRKGLIEYLRGNYIEAKHLFNQYIGKCEILDLQSIINYSAVLIALKDNAAAVAWCEKYIEQFEQDYLLCANLACAYSEIDQLKSIYYYLVSKDLEPDYKPAIQGLLINIKEIMDKQLPHLLEQIDTFPEKVYLINQFIEVMQKSTRKIAQLSIPELEFKMINDINKSIQLQLERPTLLAKLSENELSDLIRDNCKMSMDHYGITVVREAPQGYAKVNPGEIDLFFFRNGIDYENIATGENKEWSPEKFIKQLKQLLGYLRSEGGFGFTIIFNKKVRLQTVLEKRLEILQNNFKSDSDLQPFELVGPIIDLEIHWSELKEVLLTKHKHPEKEDATFRMYHFIVNVSEERHEVAVSARN